MATKQRSSGLKRPIRTAERGAAAATSLIAGIGAVWLAYTVGATLLPALAIGAGCAAGLFALLTRAHRTEANVRAREIPAWWPAFVEDLIPQYALLAEGDRQAYLERVQVFLHDQRITGVGCRPTEEDRLTIAAIAIMMVWGFPEFRYPNHREFLVYPTAFNLDYQFDDEGERIGEMQQSGPVILSLPDVRQAFRSEDRTNVVAHELAHVLDALMSPEVEEFHSEYDAQLEHLMEDGEIVAAIERQESVLDDYALEDRQEFFAVCSEVFFDDPELLREMHPPIYQWMVDVYRWDPLSRFAY